MESSNILFRLFTQRIAEIAGVVVSFDPKPIPVCLPYKSIFVSFFRTLCIELNHLFFISMSRVIGMVLVLTQTTGNALNQNLLNDLATCS